MKELVHTAAIGQFSLNIFYHREAFHGGHYSFVVFKNGLCIKNDKGYSLDAVFEVFKEYEYGAFAYIHRLQNAFSLN